MYKIILRSLILLSLCVVTLKVSAITLNVMKAADLNKQQWHDVKNLFCTSFFYAYKDLAFNQIDSAINGPHPSNLSNFLHSLFDKHYLLALKDSYSLILAYKEEQLVGYALYHRLENQTIIHIQHLAVDTSCQGQGIGKIILQAIIESNPAIEALVLTTRILNIPAQKFYRKQGFYQISTVDNLEFDSRYSILLRKDINK